jgi:cytidine deaminase
LTNNTLIQIAKEKAKQSNCRYKVSAVGFDKKGRYLGATFNKRRFHFKGGGIHAEVSLIKKYGSRLKSIFICRINKQGNLLNISPCKNCQTVADKLGIKIYSILKED